MIGRSADWLLALLGGLLLALLINYNSLLAKHTTPIFASFIAHGIGAVAAFFLIAIGSQIAGFSSGEIAHSAIKGRSWIYLGGIPGAFTVILAGITVNSKLALSGTIALMLVGQVLFGIISDCFGLFGTQKRGIVPIDFLVALTVLVGSALIIFGRA
jgi:transporter family-2 protein